MDNEDESGQELIPSVCPRILILITNGCIDGIETERYPMEVLIATRTKDHAGNTTSLAFRCFEATVDASAVALAFNTTEALTEG
jgi:hypothetical protein